ncbi:MAG: tetratricopeptide repeat protein [Opitutaceae bacterium]|nr:tetratricopeptide repeat protein [Opitutaceae bacterium]
MPRLLATLAVLLALGASGCSKKPPPEITSLQRKEAATLVSEAQFALALRDNARAEELLAKAVALCPDNGTYWLDLGVLRRRADRRDEARQAFAGAARAYAAAYQADPKDPQPRLQQIYVESLLGNAKAAQKLLKQVRADHPDHPAVKNLTPENYDKMLADPGFKALAL